MNKDTKICRKCKTLNSDRAKFCRNCGETIDDVPEIHDFSFIPCCHVGDTIKLNWNVSNVDTVTINGYDVSDKPCIEFKVDEATSFRLCARKGTKNVYRTIIVNPLPKDIEISGTTDKIITRKFHILRNLLITIIFFVILHFFIMNVQLVHHYIPVSYNDWKWISKAIEIGLGLCCLISLFLLFNSIRLCIKKKIKFK